MEFKHVLLPRAEPRVLRDAAFSGEVDPTHEERMDRTRRELFVAMTRARDTVWVGYVGEPSALLRFSARNVALTTVETEDLTPVPPA